MRDAGFHDARRTMSLQTPPTTRSRRSPGVEKRKIQRSSRARFLASSYGCSLRRWGPNSCRARQLLPPGYTRAELGFSCSGAGGGRSNSRSIRQGALRRAPSWRRATSAALPSKARRDQKRESPHRAGPRPSRGATRKTQAAAAQSPARRGAFSRSHALENPIWLRAFSSNRSRANWIKRSSSSG